MMRSPASPPRLLASNPPLFNQFAIQDDNIAPNETTSLFKDAANSNAAFLSGFAAGESFSEIQAKVNGFSPPALTNPDRLLKSPQYQKWSLEVQQAFGAATSMSIGYFGNHGIHELIQNQSANAFGFGTLPPGECTSPPVPPCADPRFSEVTELTTAGVSNYNGMVVSFQHRFTGWSQGIFQANYTYGHAFDEVSNGGSVSICFWELRGPAGSEQFPGQLRIGGLRCAPLLQCELRMGSSGEGGAARARTGLPGERMADFGDDLCPHRFSLHRDRQRGRFQPARKQFFRADLCSSGRASWSLEFPCGEGAAIPLSPHPCQPPQVLADGITPNPNARFVQAGCETGFNTGNLPGPSGPCAGPAVSFAQGRNRFRYPNYFNTDFSIMKNTKIPRWENAVLGIGFQFFNFFNHPNFGGPDNFSSDSSFGQIFYMESPPTGILGAGLGGDASPRNIQLKVQLQF